MDKSEFIRKLQAIGLPTDAIEWLEVAEGAPEELYNRCSVVRWLEQLASKLELTSCPKYKASRLKLIHKYRDDSDKLWDQYEKVRLAAYVEYAKADELARTKHDPANGGTWIRYQQESDAAYIKYRDIAGPAYAAYRQSKDNLQNEYIRNRLVLLRTKAPWSSVKEALLKYNIRHH